MNARPLRWSHFAAPARFDRLAARLVPWCGAVAALLAVAGLFVGFVVAPTDAVQGEAYRIIYVHVPTAWMSMIVYAAMAFWAAVGLVFNARLASVLAVSLAPTGALMTFLALWTGALWGKPTWGAWWVWDARLTSELLLLFLYLGFMALHGAIEDKRRADRAAGLLAIVGVVNLPVIYFSVRLGHAEQTPQHGRAHAGGHGAHGAGRLGVLHRGGAGARAAGAARARGAHRVGATLDGGGVMNASDWWELGGHGRYVWGALAMCAAVLVAEVALLVLRARLQRRQRDDEAVTASLTGSLAAAPAERARRESAP